MMSLVPLLPPKQPKGIGPWQKRTLGLNIWLLDTVCGCSSQQGLLRRDMSITIKLLSIFQNTFKNSYCRYLRNTCRQNLPNSFKSCSTGFYPLRANEKQIILKLTSLGLHYPQRVYFYSGEVNEVRNISTLSC